MPRDSKPHTVYWLDGNLYLNITNKCSNQCIFCLRNFKRGVGEFTLKLNSEPTFEQVISEFEEALKRRTWKEVVFCGFGEPTERLDLLLDLSRWIKKNHRNIVLRLNTNGQGYLLNKGRHIVDDLKAAGIDKISVSLNASDEETYKEVCKPSLANAYPAILDFIRNAKKTLDVEVTTVTTPEVEVAKVERLAARLGVKFRLRPCIPCFW